MVIHFMQQCVHSQPASQFSCSVIPASLRLHGLQHAGMLSLPITNFQSLFKLMSIKSVMPCNQLILCCPLLLLPSIFPNVRVFSSESVLHIRWAKYWSFSFSISPSNEYSGLISFRIDWLDLLATNQCVIPNYPFPNLPFPTPATISLFSTSVSLFLFCK